MEIPVKRFHSFRFQKDGKLECELIRSRVENSCKSLQCGVLPSGHLVTFSDAVSIVEEASIYTQLFFSANGDNIRPSQAKTIKSPELASEKEVDISRPYAPATVKTRRRVSRLRYVLFFFSTLFKLLASATKIARKSYFPLLYFVFLTVAPTLITLRISWYFPV